MRPAWKTALVVGVLTVWLSTAGFAGYDRASLVGDLAEFVNNPVRVLHGEMPYRDFWLLHPPGEVFLPALVYRLGFGVNAVLLLNVLISVLVGLAAFWLGHMLTGSAVEATLAATLVFFAGVPAEYVGFSYLHMYVLLLLVAAILLAHYLAAHGRASLFFAGAAVGLAFLFKFYLTGAAAAAMAATVVIEARHRSCPWGTTIRYLSILGGGCTLSLACGLIWIANLLPDMWHAVVIDSVSHAVTRRMPFGHSIVESWAELKESLVELGTSPARPGAYFWTAVETSELLKTSFLHVLPFLAIPVWLYRTSLRAASRRGADWMLLFFVLWGSLTFIRPLLRGAHPGQLAQATTPLFLALILVLRPLLAHWRATKSISAGLAACALAATAVGVGQAALSVTLKQLALARHPAHVVRAPYGTIVFSEGWRADELRELIAVVRENTAEQDSVFVIPWQAPALYALTRRHNPTYYDSTIDLFYRPVEERQRQVCSALLEKNTKLIIAWSHLPGPGWDKVEWESELPLVNAYVEDHFERMSDVGRFRIWRGRKESVRTGSAAENVRAPGP